MKEEEIKENLEKESNKNIDEELDKVAGGANYESDEEWIINGETNEIKKSDDKKN